MEPYQTELGGVAERQAAKGYLQSHFVYVLRRQATDKTQQG